ncbi:protein yippee-like [Anopheles marshallii]|uniref:protein yippee-like n=1 Tax=Anopheles marshallii TaxID=1521116 RepID=UPI00237B4129|nr:protein yippee-like [Anopheles marshallii]
MGRIFLEHINGQKLYNCAACNTNLTNWEQLISTRYIGTTGPAYLFRRVVNLTQSEVQYRYMNTGHHLVRDVMCKKCKVKLGWMYEFAMQKPQEFKEGAVLLERSKIVESKGFKDIEE